MSFPIFCYSLRKIISIKRKHDCRLSIVKKVNASFAMNIIANAFKDHKMAVAPIDEQTVAFTVWGSTEGAQ